MGLYTFCVINIFEKSSTQKKRKKKKISNPKMFEKLIEKGVWSWCLLYFLWSNEPNEKKWLVICTTSKMMKKRYYNQSMLMNKLYSYFILYLYNNFSIWWNWKLIKEIWSFQLIFNVSQKVLHFSNPDQKESWFKILTLEPGEKKYSIKFWEVAILLEIINKK